MNIQHQVFPISVTGLFPNTGKKLLSSISSTVYYEYVLWKILLSKMLEHLFSLKAAILRPYKVQCFRTISSTVMLLLTYIYSKEVTPLPMNLRTTGRPLLWNPRGREIPLSVWRDLLRLLSAQTSSVFSHIQKTAYRLCGRTKSTGNICLTRVKTETGWFSSIFAHSSLFKTKIDTRANLISRRAQEVCKVSMKAVRTERRTRSIRSGKSYQSEF